MEAQATKKPEDVANVDVHTAKVLLSTGHKYLDVRTEEEYNESHVESGINVPYMFFTPEGKVKNPEFLSQVASICKKDDSLVVGCSKGGRSLLACVDLLKAGYGNVNNMEGGYTAWVDNGLAGDKPGEELKIACKFKPEPNTTSLSYRPGDIANVDVYTAKGLLSIGHKYLDVRTEEEYNKSHVEDAVNVPYMFFTPQGKVKNPEFLSQVASICKEDDCLVVGCNSGGRSRLACLELLNAGYKKVNNMEGGYSTWVDKGLAGNKPAEELKTACKFKPESTNLNPRD